MPELNHHVGDNAAVSREAPERAEVPLSKSRIVFIMMIVLFFLAVSMWLAIEHPRSWKFSPEVVMVAGGVCSAFAFFALCMLVTRLTQSQAGLVFDSKGLVDRASGIPLGRIEWSDISAISLSYASPQEKRVQKGPLLVILHVNNPESYISHLPWGIRRMVAKFYLWKWGTPIVIYPTLVSVNWDGLIALIEKFSGLKVGRPDSL